MKGAFHAGGEGIGKCPVWGILKITFKCWRRYLYPQQLGDVQLGHLPTPVFFLHLGVSINGRSPIAGWFIMENPKIKWILGHHFHLFHQTIHPTRGRDFCHGSEGPGAARSIRSTATASPEDF